MMLRFMLDMKTIKKNMTLKDDEHYYGRHCSPRVFTNVKYMKVDLMTFMMLEP